MIHGENGLVAREADEFADHVVRLWRDPACACAGHAERNDSEPGGPLEGLQGQHGRN